MRYKWVFVLTIIFFLVFLYFGLNQVEKEVNKMLGIDSPSRSFSLQVDQKERVIITFAGTEFSLSFSGIKKVLGYPGRLIFTSWQRINYNYGNINKHKNR